MYESNGFFGKLYSVMEWITRIAYVNVLWVIFTIIGGILIGLAPATASMYAITRKWVKGESDIPIFRTFWQTYKSSFLSTNLLAWPLALIGYILYLNYQYLFLVDSPYFYLMLFVFVNISLLYIVICLYLFPVYVHFQSRLFQYYKHALLAGISSPFHTATMIVCIILIGLLVERVPGLLPFFPACLISFVVMHLAYRSFIKFKTKKDSEDLPHAS